MLKAYWLQPRNFKTNLFQCFLAFVTVVSLWFSLFTEESFGASNVQVTLPDFKVTLNGQVVENSYRKYPLIVYKNITYFPMTYDDSRFLGLQSNWTQAEGLTIQLFAGNAPYKEEKVGTKNNNVYQAELVTDKISVNGKSINNQKEEYPLLVFRNVTYFPLTWRFAAVEFKWSYNYSNQGGLVIDKAKNSETKPTQPNVPVSTGGAVPTVSYNQTLEGKVLTILTVPKVYGPEKNLRGAMVIVGNNLFFEGVGGAIYQAPVANPSQVKLVYQLPTNSFNSKDFELAGLRNTNGMAVLNYRSGGATMGTDHQIHLKEDGTWENLSMFNQSYCESFNGTKIGFALTSPPSPGNLNIQYSGLTKAESIGDSSYYYGWYFGEKNNLIGNSNSLELLGDSVYVLARKGGERSQLYKVEIKTGEVQNVSDADVKEFKIDGQWIYFTSGDQKLYRMDLKGENVQMLNITGGLIGNFDVQQGYVAYWLNDTNGKSIAFRVLNPAGKTVFETGDHVYNVQIKDGNIQYVRS